MIPISIISTDLKIFLLRTRRKDWLALWNLASFRPREQIQLCREKVFMMKRVLLKHFFIYENFILPESCRVVLSEVSPSLAEFIHIEASGSLRRLAIWNERTNEVCWGKNIILSKLIWFQKLLCVLLSLRAAAFAHCGETASAFRKATMQSSPSGNCNT